MKQELESQKEAIECERERVRLKSEADAKQRALDEGARELAVRKATEEAAAIVAASEA